MRYEYVLTTEKFLVSGEGFNTYLWFEKLYFYLREKKYVLHLHGEGKCILHLPRDGTYVLLSPGDEKYILHLRGWKAYCTYLGMGSTMSIYRYKKYHTYVKNVSMNRNNVSCWYLQFHRYEKMKCLTQVLVNFSSIGLFSTFRSETLLPRH